MWPGISRSAFVWQRKRALHKTEHLKPILFPAETLLEEATVAHSSGRWSFYLLCGEQSAGPLPGFLKAH